MKTSVLAPKCKEFEICHSHSHKEKGEQTENHQCFLDSSENWVQKAKYFQEN